MIDYDVVVNIGCSFMNGDAIDDTIQSNLVSGKLLSEKLNCDYVHLAGSGFSNERIIRNIYEWVENNNETGHYEKPFVLIGLTDLARYQFKSKLNNMWYDLQPAQIDTYDDDSLKIYNERKVTGGIDTHQNLRKWLTYYLKWFFDTEVEEKKLQRNIIMLHHYLKGNNCDYRIINSLQDNLNNIKSKINYVSFIDDEYKGNDVWRDYLMWQVKNIDGEDYNDVRNRSPITPYGKRFCKGHPSPNANKELFKRIYESLK